MKVSSFDFKRMTIMVKASDAKNKSKDQIIPLHPLLLPILKSLCAGKEREDLIFNMMRREDAAKLVRSDCEKAKVNTTHIDFHCLRHTFVTLLAEANIHPKVVQVLARHEDIKTTLNHYTHFKQADEVDAIASLM